MAPEEPDARERARRVIERAERRDRAVVTPDNAVSPFDASATTLLSVPGRERSRRSGAARPAAPRGEDEAPTTPVAVAEADRRNPAGTGAGASGSADDAAVTEDIATSGAAVTESIATSGGGSPAAARPATAPFTPVAETPPRRPRRWWHRLRLRRA